MIKKFIEKHDFSYLPIGPQAELIESLKVLNRSIPHVFRDSIYDNPSFPTIKFDVNKNFTWKYGTFKNAEAIKNFLEGSYKHRGFKWGSIRNIWERTDRNKRTYNYQGFKRRIFDVDTMLQNKRWKNEIWLDDKDKIESLFSICAEEITKIFDDYIQYIGMINKDHVMEEGIDIIETNFTISDEDFEARKVFYNNIMTEMWKFDDTKPKILFNSRSDRPNQSTITIIHPFKDVTMNVYVVENKVPVFTFPVGHVIGSYECTLENLMYSTLKLSHNHNMNGGTRTRYWFKPYIQGLQHPFMNYPHMGRLGNSWRFNDPSSWPIEYQSSSNTCAGNINIVDGMNKKVNLIKWIENVYTWISTFRLGITHPLNSITYSYFGNPERLDPNVKGEYLDRVGFSQTNCYDRLNNWHPTAIERNKICNKFCTDDIMSECGGFQGDLKYIEREKIDLLFKENSMDERKIHSELPIESSMISEETENDNYPMQYFADNGSSSNELSEDMLRWVSLNQNAQNR